MYFLEPQKIRKGETSIEFAERVRKMIAETANLKMVQWDGYLKYMAPSPKLCEQRREKIADKFKTSILKYEEGTSKEKSKHVGGNSTEGSPRRFSLRGRPRSRS